MILPFCFYWKLFHHNPEARLIFRGDFLNQHYVWKSYALERFKAGELPLWSPNVLGGVPFHANPQVGLFYPPTYLLFPFHHGGTVSYMALEAYQLLHQAFGAIGLFLLLRWLGVGALAGSAGGLIFAFTGFFTTPGHHALVVTASWIPWVLLATAKTVTDHRLRSMGLLSLPLALMMLGGHPQPAYYGILIASAWALFLGGWRSTWQRYAPALLLALAVASVQILPTYVLAHDSTRGTGGYDYATTFDFSAYFLSAALLPLGQVRLPGQDPSAPLHLYVGVGTLLLAAVGLLASGDRRRLFFAFSAALALLLALGADSFLFDVAYGILPGFSAFRIPFRLLGLYGLGMAVLAAFGTESLIASSYRRARRRLKGLLPVTFGLVLVLATWSAYLHTSLLRSPGALGPREVERLVAGSNWALILALANAFLLIAWFRSRGQSWTIWALVALLVIDLGSFVKSRGQHPYSTLVRAEERPVHRWLRAQNYLARYVTDADLESYAMLHGVHSAGGQDSLIDERYAHVLDLAGESANVLALLNAKLVARTTPVSQFPWCGPRFPAPMPLVDAVPELDPIRLRFLPVPEVRHLRVRASPLGPGGAAALEVGDESYPIRGDEDLELSFEEASPLRELALRIAPGNPGIELHDIELDSNPLGLKVDYVDLGEIRLNVHALPRAYFAAEIPAPDPASSIEPPESLTCWTPYDPLHIVDPESGQIRYALYRNELVDVRRYSPELVELESSSPRPGFVILSDTFRPGWRADVDGRKAPLLRAQQAFRAVPVPAGRHRIQLRYRPASFFWGAGISILGVLVLAALLWAPSFLRRSRPEAA